MKTTQGLEKLTIAEARQLVAEDILKRLANDQSSIWDIIWNGCKGVDDMTLQDIEDYFSDDDELFIGRSYFD